MTTTIRIGETDVPRVGLGTNRLQDTGENARFIREAIDAGIRHIDTAHLYSGGQSEAAIGAALASGRPDDLVLATKGGYHDSRPQTREIATRRGATPTQVALAWLLHRSPATLPIPGTLSTKHVRENLRALDVELDEDDLAALGACTKRLNASSLAHARASRRPAVVARTAAVRRARARAAAPSPRPRRRIARARAGSRSCSTLRRVTR